MKIIVFLLSVLTLLFYNEKQESIPTINLVPLEYVPNSDINFVKKELEKFYGANVIVHNQLPLTSKLKVDGLKKYRANNILVYLENEFKNVDGKVLAITKKDICTDRTLNGVVYKNWGIFGFGSVGGKSCVVSTSRFKDKYFERLSKVSIHEVGHTLGIPHCQSNVDCVMNDANGKGSRVDNNKKWMCDKCKRKIKWE
jgi:archaemetzincin